MITEIQSCFDRFVTFHDFINSFTLYNGFIHTNVTLAFSARPLRSLLLEEEYHKERVLKIQSKMVQLCKVWFNDSLVPNVLLFTNFGHN